MHETTNPLSRTYTSPYTSGALGDTSRMITLLTDEPSVLTMWYSLKRSSGGGSMT